MEAERGTRGALHAEPHHELDGFVHHGAHHPFALPDDDDHEKEDELVFGSKLPSSTSLRRMASFRSMASLDESETKEWHQHDVETADDAGTVLPLASTSLGKRAKSWSGRGGSSPEDRARRDAARRRTLSDLPPPPPSPDSKPSTPAHLDEVGESKQL